MNRCSIRDFLEFQNQTEWILFYEYIRRLNFVRKRISKAQVHRLRFSLHGGQAMASMRSVYRFFLFESAAARAKKAKCRWPASLHFWSTEPRRFFRSKNLFLFFDPKDISLTPTFNLISFFLRMNRIVDSDFYFLFLMNINPLSLIFFF